MQVRTNSPWISQDEQYETTSFRWEGRGHSGRREHRGVVGRSWPPYLADHPGRRRSCSAPLQRQPQAGVSAPERRGFRRGGAHQPQRVRSGGGDERARRNRSGHSRSQRLSPLAGPAVRPRPADSRAGNGRHPPGIPRLQGVRRHHGSGRARGRQPQGRLPRRLQTLARKHQEAYPRRPGQRRQDCHRGSLEQVPLEPPRVRPLYRRVREPLGRRVLRRRQRRRIRLSRGMDPRARQANPQGSHQGVCKTQTVQLPPGRGGGNQLEPPSEAPCATVATTAGSPRKYRMATWKK